jgi:hypothetical protein
MPREIESASLSDPYGQLETLTRVVREFLDARERGTRHIEHQALARMRAALEETEGEYRK